VGCGRGREIGRGGIVVGDLVDITVDAEAILEEA